MMLDAQYRSPIGDCLWRIDCVLPSHGACEIFVGYPVCRIRAQKR